MILKHIWNNAATENTTNFNNIPNDQSLSNHQRYVDMEIEVRSCNNGYEIESFTIDKI